MMPLLAVGVMGLVIGGYVGVDWGGQARYDSGYAAGQRDERAAQVKEQTLQSETVKRQRGEDNVRQQFKDQADRETARVTLATTTGRINLDAARLVERVRVAPTATLDGSRRLPTLSIDPPGGARLPADPTGLLSGADREEAIRDARLADAAVATLAACASSYPVRIQ